MAELEEISKYMSENKGKRKFKQSVELAINFKNIDFSKQDNRLNMEILLPNGKGKIKKIALFANEKNLIAQAEKNNVDVISDVDLPAIAADNVRMNALLNYELIAQPNLMPVIARHLGQFLGPRNKMPKPLLGNINFENIVKELNKRIVIRNKGKFLPTIHCVVGYEDMEPEKIYTNVKEVMDSITKKVGPNHIKSAYLKLTMSKPVKIM